nr:unnamed protein product [Digitaria exilis]
MDAAAEIRDGSHGVPDVSPAAAAAAVPADGVKMEAADGRDAVEEPSAARAAASEAEVGRDVGASVSEVDAAAEDHSTAPGADAVDAGGTAGQGRSAVSAANEGTVPEEARHVAPLVSEAKMEVDEPAAASKEDSAASAVSEVVDAGCIREQEFTAAGDVKMEEGDDRVANQGPATSAGCLQGKEVAGQCLVGRYIGRSALGHARILIGKVASYDSTTGVYSVVFEDGHGEDLGFPQLQEFLMSNENGALGMKVSCRKRKLDLLVSSGSTSEVKEPASTRQRVDGCETAAKDGAPQHSGSGSDMSEDVESSSNSSDFTKEEPSQPCPPVQAVELPPSSGDITVPENSISYLFSVYNFLRSFSVQLFLSIWIGRY